MSSHESVSCDSCMKANFKGRRYKCLVCYDYDLCATCYEAGVTTGRHSTDHAMQCILTRADFELYYGGDTVSSEQPQSYTCPYCGNMGFSEVSLSEHVNVQHSDSSSEVICPICAALPGGDPNLVSDDFQEHLQMEHRVRGGLFESEAPGRQRRQIARCARGGRSRHFTPATNANNTPASAVPREPMDPIAELLSHLSGVHNRLNMRGTPQQLREIQMQIEAERHAIRIPQESLSSYREHLQRLPRRAGGMYEPPTLAAAAANGNIESGRLGGLGAHPSGSNQPKTLLSRYLEEPKPTGRDLENREISNAEQSLFIQEVLLATLTDSKLNLGNSSGDATHDTVNSLELSQDTITSSAIPSPSEPVVTQSQTTRMTSGGPQITRPIAGNITPSSTVASRRPPRATNSPARNVAQSPATPVSLIRSVEVSEPPQRRPEPSRGGPIIAQATPDPDERR